MQWTAPKFAERNGGGEPAASGQQTSKYSAGGGRARQGSALGEKAEQDDGGGNAQPSWMDLFLHSALYTVDARPACARLWFQQANVWRRLILGWRKLADRG